MSPFLWRMFAAFWVGMLGLTLMFWQLEHASLHSFAGEGRPSPAVYALLFAGLLLVNGSGFYALTRWSRFVHEHPNAGQAPAWLLVSIIVFAGAALITGVAVHAGYIRAQDPIPMEISQGFIAYEVVFTAMIIVPLILLAVRWSRGYRQR